jgi:hypothetical protein
MENGTLAKVGHVWGTRLLPLRHTVLSVSLSALNSAKFKVLTSKV